MLTFISRRIVASLPVVLGVVTLSFALMYLLPGDPVSTMLARSGASAQQIEQLREQLGLNLPLYQQYFSYLGNVLRGDFGRSIVSSDSVLNLLANSVPSTLLLATLAMLVAIPVGILLGAVAAVSKSVWFDRLVLGFNAVSISVPAFWFGLMMVLLFSVQLGWLPASGQGSIAHLVLPTLTLSLGATATIAKAARTSMLDVLKQDYILTARAQGKSDVSIMFKHALPNAMISVVTMIGLQFGWLFSGAFFVEAAFSRKGLGSVMVDAILDKDFPLVQGAVLLTSLVYVALNIVIDVIYALIDPRIRFE
ncbi:ABC transporter permease subunit [Rhizobium sp. CRIBSB]|nr:ABC transporter permease subunit [Rhizobium sp. CRIBSB]